jgi:hypothetical protein
MKTPGLLLFIIGLLSLSGGPLSAQRSYPPLILHDRTTDALSYVEDERGNRVPDYSYCGYNLSDTEIPWIPVRAFVPAGEGDATATIQRAIDRVSALPPDASGFRGAVLLDRGTFTLQGSLYIRTSGVVLRGHGSGEGGTTLLGAGTGRDAVLYLTGKPDREQGPAVEITDDYVPLNAMTVTVSDASALKPGDRVLIHRPSTEKWIQTLGCDYFGGDIYNMIWRPGDKDLYFDRRIERMEGNRIILDAPLTNALEKEFADSRLIPYTWPGRISNVGVEGIAFASEYNRANEKDEDHRWIAVQFNSLENGWVRQAAFRHFAGSSVFVGEDAAKITVEDCLTADPISEIGGFRRYTYYSMGQQVLFQRCSSHRGWHDFAIGQCSTGPTAFVQCESLEPYSFSGGTASWATAALFDLVTVEGGIITMMNRGQDGNGAGWNLANSLLWNTTAARIECYRPPTAQNWVMGCWAKYKGDGYWYEVDTHLRPHSIFYAQLAARLGRDVSAQARQQPRDTNESTSPTLEQAARLIALAYEPMQRMYEWVATARIPEEALERSGVKSAVWETAPARTEAIEDPLTLEHGKLVRGRKLLIGGSQGIVYWNGSLNPSYTSTARPHITRFVPGRTGTGFTDDLDELTDSMVSRGIVSMKHNPALWYERRRDDHERILREDGDVWAPFYEMPFARSGQGRAWDGLSRYDLTSYNRWYFDRLRRYVELADRKGLLLVNQHYHQHSILEAGAHWADYPWRSANNVNETGFPEPVNYAGHKRIFMAEPFYDVTNEHRVDLHRRFIRHHLDNFPPGSGVLHAISSEFTGPAHFAELWAETIGRWQRESGRDAWVMLSATKDVQDSLLSVPALAGVVDVIDICYWFYRSDGSLYAPEGGKNLAPRQHARQVAPGLASEESVYRAVKEYRDRFPDKAVTYSATGSQYGWAILMAGGSLPSVRVSDAGFSGAVAGMSPVEGDREESWALSGSAGYLIYPRGEEAFAFPVGNGRYERFSIDPDSGTVTSQGTIRVTRNTIEISAGQGVVWLKRK